MSITLEQAQTAIAASIKKSNELGVKVAIAVLDDRAQIVAIARMDDANFQFLPEAAQGKAMATVLWNGATSGALTERSSMPIFAAVNQMYGSKVIYQQGAVPLMQSGKLVGAIGAGGATSQIDEDIAQAGADAISN